MVHTIGPVGNGAGVPSSRARWGLFHILGGALGGAVVAALFATLFHVAPLPPRLAAAVLGLCALALAADFRLFRFKLPSSNRQVPASWRRRLRPSVCAFAFGAGLGFAFGTRVRFALTYVVLIGSAVILPFGTAVGV